MARGRCPRIYNLELFPANGDPIKRQIKGTGDWGDNGRLIIFNNDEVIFQTTMEYTMRIKYLESDHDPETGEC